MSITAPTPEQFLASPSDPDEDVEPVAAPAPTPTAEVGQVAPRDSLASIADALQRITVVVEKVEDEAAEESQSRLLIEDLQRENRELEALHDAKQGLIEQALAILKPSTSKLANNLRAVLEPVVTAPEPAPEPGAAPAHDAPVEEWRAYARSKGYQGPDVDQANRSVIRTMLGIPQPVEGGDA